MPKVVVKADNGDTVSEHNFPDASVYALARMPSCPTHVGVNNLLNWLKRALTDAEMVQRGVDSRRLSERVMDRLAAQGETNEEGE